MKNDLIVYNPNLKRMETAKGGYTNSFDAYKHDVIIAELQASLKEPTAIDALIRVLKLFQTYDYMSVRKCMDELGFKKVR